jgi:hypothetical protein
MVRFVAAHITATMTIDIYLDDELVAAATDLPIEGGTDYALIPAGPHVAKVVLAGEPPDDAILEFPFDALADTNYSLATYGDELAMLSVIDDPAGLDLDQVRMQLIHVAADLGQIDIYALLDQGDIEPLFLDVDHETSTTQDIPAGAGAVGIDLDDDMVLDQVFSIPDLGANVLIDLYLVNENGGEPVFLLAHLPDGTTMRIDDACGDGLVEPFEVCDGANLDGQTCADEGFFGGVLGCQLDCGGYDTSGCVSSNAYCSLAPVAIPDLDANGVTVNINVPDMLTIVDVDVEIDITHTYLADLDATLSLGNTTVPLFSDIAAMGGGFCNGDNMLATLDAEAGSSIETNACVNVNVPAVNGTYQAEGNLSNFDGVNAQGNWSFFIADDGFGDLGTVNEVCLNIVGN